MFSTGIFIMKLTLSVLFTFKTKLEVLSQCFENNTFSLYCFLQFIYLQGCKYVFIFNNKTRTFSKMHKKHPVWTSNWLRGKSKKKSTQLH